MKKKLMVCLVCLIGSGVFGVSAEPQKSIAPFSASLEVKQAASENSLAAVRRNDSSARDPNGNIARLSPAEHMRRASVYMSNRAFEEARAHWQALLTYYPEDTRAPEAMLG